MSRGQTELIVVPTQSGPTIVVDRQSWRSADGYG